MPDRPSTSASGPAVGDYTTLSTADIERLLNDTADDAESAFGRLDASQLNWRPDATRWSVAQCFDHLLTSNRLMLRAAQDALDRTRSKSLWQRLPVWPSLFGRLMVRTLGPRVTRKFSAPRAARPAVSEISADVIRRFAAQERELASWTRSLDADAQRTIMTSPFARVVTYSVMDGCRIVATHGRRHFEQARRVMETPGFPGVSAQPETGSVPRER